MQTTTDARPALSVRRHYLTNAAAQGSSRLVAAVANLATFVLLARTLGTAALGQFSYVLAFLAVAASFADLGTTAVLARGLAQSRSADRNEYLGRFLILRLSLAAIVVVIAALCAPWVNPPLASALFVCSLGVPFVTSRFVEYIFQVEERPWYALLSSGVYAGLQIGAAVVILVWGRQPLLPFVIGYMGAHVVYTALGWSLAWRLLRPRFRWDGAEMRRMLALAAPLGVASFFTMVNSRADTFLLTYLRSAAEVGVYNAAYRFLDGGAMVALAVSAPLVPVLSRKYLEGRDRARVAYARVTEAIALGTLPIALVTPWVSEPVIRVIYGPAFVGAAPVLNVLAWVQLVMMYCLVSTSMNLAAGVVRPGYWNAAVAAAVNIALNLVLIPRYGILGAAWATLASEICLLVVSQAYVSRSLGGGIERSAWLRILALNAALAVTLQLTARRFGIWGVLLSLAVYGPLAFRFRPARSPATAR